MNDIIQQNIDFIRNQYIKQKKIIENILQLEEGTIITVVGENGAGKTNYVTLTCPFKHTIYFNFEANGSAKIASALDSAKLIKYVPDVENILLALKQLCDKDHPYKVVVIDSFKEMINHLIERKFQGNSKNSQDFHLKIANEFIGSIGPQLQMYYKQLTKKGISVIQLCGISDFDNKDENLIDNLQCYVKSAKEFIRTYSNHIFILRNKKRESQFSLAKDNGGFLDYSYDTFFTNRNLIYNSDNKSPVELEYKDSNLIPYGIANILATLSKKQQDLIEGLKGFED